MATLFVPPSMRSLTNGERRIEVGSASVRALIDELELAHPGFRASLVDGDRLRPGLAIAIDGVASSDGLLAKIPAGAEVHILPAIAGGQPATTNAGGQPATTNARGESPAT